MAALKVAAMPALIYGTAWKKDRTRSLVKQALLTGFRGVDTAAQPKHYQEDLVGQGIRDAIENGIRREELYIQTKYTPVAGQDPRRVPYDPAMPLKQQVAASVRSSLHNLRPTENDDAHSYIDCLVLHSPLQARADMEEVWKAMESHVPDQVRTLGISNIYQIEALRELYGQASVKPSVVQNRFYSMSGYDKDIRAFCADKGIIYQSFWTLTADQSRLLRSKAVAYVAEEASVSNVAALYGLVLGLENTRVLVGTTNGEHMREDLDGVTKVAEWAKSSPDVWKHAKEGFMAMID